MRFIVTGEWSKNSLLHLIVFFFLIYVSFFWLSNLLLFFHKMNLDYDSIVMYYRGSEESYRQPRSYQGLLEVSHFHLFSMGILMLTVTHLLLFIPLANALKMILIVLCFGSAFADEASNWLIRYVHPLFAYMKIISFTTLQLSLAAVLLLSLIGLIKRKPSAYMDSDVRKKK